MEFDLSNHMSWPRIGSVWNHHNGNNYTVVMFTNIETNRQDKYPTTIVYRNTANGKFYSRKLIDWHRSMVKVHD